MKLILNIGLAREGKPDIGPCVALNVLRANGFIVEASKVEQSDTEKTLVAVVALAHDRNVSVHGLVRHTAAELEQEVIAAYKVERARGVMLGCDIDHDDAWGAFNPALFIMPDGRRLSHHLGA